MNSKKKINVLHFLGQGNIGGQERSIYQVLKGFKNDDDFDVGIAIGRNTGIYVERIMKLDIPTIFLQLKNGFSLNFDRTILNQLKDYDVHHLHDPSPNFILYSLLAGSKVKRAFTRRGGIQKYPLLSVKKSLKFHIKKLLINHFFDGYSGNTINATESVKQQYGITNRRIFALYNGIDFSLLEPSVNREHVLKSNHLCVSNFIIGTACHLVDWKRVDLLIRAFARCRIDNKTLLILGKGHQHRRLKRLAQSLNLNNQVIFAGEVLNIANYLQILNCFVLASTNAESFGNAVVEAMYSKIPSVIISDSNGLKEHISHRTTGFIARDESDLAKQIEYIYQNSAEAKQVAENASTYVVNKYSIDNMLRSYKDFYWHILGRKNKRSKRFAA